MDDLVEYQSIAYARHHAELVQRVVSVERERVLGSTAIGTASAVGLHKLMAYKDEYEVARLHLDAAERARLLVEHGPGAKVFWHLHPPLLPALGLNRKLRLGPRFRPVLAGCVVCDSCVARRSTPSATRGSVARSVP